MKRLLIFCMTVCLLISLVACATPGEMGDTGENYRFSYQGHSFTIGDAEDGLIDALGPYKDLDFDANCNNGYQDKIYTYSGFELYLVYDNGYRVQRIALYDDTVSTPEGICIGSSEELVKEVLGDADEEKTNGFRYFGRSMILDILIRDGAVYSIQYLEKP